MTSHSPPKGVGRKTFGIFPVTFHTYPERPYQKTLYLPYSRHRRSICGKRSMPGTTIDLGINSVTTFLAQEEERVASQHYEYDLKDWDDIEKIQPMKLTYNPGQTVQHLEEAKEIFKGIAPVRVGVWDTISMLTGVGTIYYELLNRPEFFARHHGTLYFVCPIWN